ncbi:MAG: pantetheine-phosphate adenylyltransferase [Pseudomonadota bacterium]
MTPERVAVYPGTFDPITKGHLDIVQRACPLVDRLVVAVAQNGGKRPLFSHQERFDMVARDIEQLKQDQPNLETIIEVMSFEILLVDFVQKLGSQIIIRGLRAVSDFEYEFKMASMNEHLAPEVETVFLMASDRFQFVSSQFIKEIARLGGDVSPFISNLVKQQLDAKFGVR